MLGRVFLSRGVKSVIFVENYNSVLKILKKNLNNLERINNYEIIEHNIYSDELYDELKYKFDLIFLDPPYKDKNIKYILMKIKTQQILNKKGIIILHRHKNAADIFPEEFKVLEEKNMGYRK